MGHVPGLSQWRLFWSYFCLLFKSLVVSNAQLIYFTHKIHICFSPNASIMAINLSLMLTVAICVPSSRWRCLLLLNSGSRVTWRGQCWSSSPLWESAWNEGVGGVGRGFWEKRNKNEKFPWVKSWCTAYYAVQWIRKSGHNGPVKQTAPKLPIFFSCDWKCRNIMSTFEKVPLNFPL